MKLKTDSKYLFQSNVVLPPKAEFYVSQHNIESYQTGVIFSLKRSCKIRIGSEK